jgi:hypothetical protein
MGDWVYDARANNFDLIGFPNNFIEQDLGVLATSRNWSTVTKIIEFAQRKPAV